MEKEILFFVRVGPRHQSFLQDKKERIRIPLQQQAMFLDLPMLHPHAHKQSLPEPNKHSNKSQTSRDFLMSVSHIPDLPIEKDLSPKKMPVDIMDHERNVL